VSVHSPNRTTLARRGECPLTFRATPGVSTNIVKLPNLASAGHNPGTRWTPTRRQLGNSDRAAVGVAKLGNNSASVGHQLGTKVTTTPLPLVSRRDVVWVGNRRASIGHQNGTNCATRMSKGSGRPIRGSCGPRLRGFGAGLTPGFAWPNEGRALLRPECTGAASPKSDLKMG